MTPTPSLRRLPAATLLLTALLLTGCAGGSASGDVPPSAEPDRAATAATTAGAEGSADDEGTAAVVETPADLPAWFPADAPMPRGAFDYAIEDPDGVFLYFRIGGEGDVAELLERLDAAGYAEYAMDDHGEGRKTWFTDGAGHRINLAVRGLGTDETTLDYRVEPK